MNKTLCGIAVLAVLASGNALAHKEGDFIVRWWLGSSSTK